MEIRTKLIGQMKVGDKGFVHPDAFRGGEIDERAYIGNYPTPGFWEIEKLSENAYLFIREIKKESN